MAGVGEQVHEMAEGFVGDLLIGKPAAKVLEVGVIAARQPNGKLALGEASENLVGCAWCADKVAVTACPPTRKLVPLIRRVAPV
jgi:hypothetical protein